MAHSKDDDYRRREQDLKERELDIRLRELEHEIEKKHRHQQEVDTEAARAVEVTTDEPNAGRKKNRMMRNIMNGGKLFLLMVVVFAATRIAYWLATIIIVATVLFAAYMLFIDK